MSGEFTTSVGLGERALSDRRGCQLVTYGLGSCVGLVIWGWRGEDRVVGLAHVVMPDSRGQAGTQTAKYADTAVADMARALMAAGCSAASLQAVIGGGASMFPRLPVGDIGASNVARIREELRRLNIPLRAEAVGGHRGRTLRASVGDGRIVVSTVGGDEVELWRGDEPVPSGTRRRAP
jgi:chemotaxis protein CheD